MGNCGTEKKEPQFIKYTKEELQDHFISIIKLEHFHKRQQSLKKQAVDDIDRIINASMELIRVRKEFILNSFNQQIKEMQQNDKEMQRLKKNNMTVEQYIGKSDTEQTVRTYTQEVQDKFITVKGELEQNMNVTFRSMKEDIQSKSINQIEPQAQNYIKEKFISWRVNNRDKVKLAVLEIQNRFKDQLTHDYFRNKLKSVVTAQDVKQNIVKAKPRRLSTVQSITVIQQNELIGSTTDIGKGWFCCMPKR